MISLGLEELIAAPPASLAGKRLGLLCNQASTDANFIHSRDRIMAAFPGQLGCLFSPQHGFFSEKQDNMVESAHGVDQPCGLPVFSLYGDVRRPTAEMFALIDVLLIDLIDVGTRVYTFIYTMAYCLQAAREFGKKVLVLDRPNPIGGDKIEGNILQKDFTSFVGLYPLPMRHGLTMGELAKLINTEFAINCDLEVIAMSGWRRHMLFSETGLPWVFPSPNMPAAATALVYPGQVIWEGTNISEGRGTTLPFEIFGAPFFEHQRLASHIAKIPLPGCILRPLAFEPSFNKWQGEKCTGFQIHVTDAASFKPYLTGLALLQAVLQLYPEQFSYKAPPYEYEYEKLPMDMILGDGKLRQELIDTDMMELENAWQDELTAFAELRTAYFLYS